MPRAHAEAYFVAAGVDAAVAAEVCAAAYGGGDVVADRTAFAMGCKLVAMHQAHVPLTAANVIKPTPLPEIFPHGQQHLEDGADPQRPWLDMHAAHAELKATVLANGSGAFAIRKESASQFIVLLNVHGTVVEAPVDFGLRAGAKCYMLGDVAHPTLESLVASLASEDVLASITTGTEAVAAAGLPLFLLFFFGQNTGTYLARAGRRSASLFVLSFPQ